MTLDLTGINLSAGQGLSYWVLGDLYTFKAVGEETGQAYALAEITVQPQNGTPPHIHHQESESFYVQEGELEFQLDQQVITATAGTFLHSPKGQLHRFTNTGSMPARMLCWVTPAGLEKFFIELGQPVQDPADPPPSVSPADIARAIASAPKYGLEIIPPPSEAS
jgi:quercetin dioxygenase-like cupin family protein